MTVYRATFTVAHHSGEEIEDAFVHNDFEQALEESFEGFYAMDEDEREGEYAVKLERVEVDPS